MTSDDEVAVRQLPGAFDRLTTALHGNAKRRRLAGLAVAVLLMVGGFGVFDGRAQSQKNQTHIDCIIAVLARQDPPKCRPVREKLIRDGIIPPVLPAPQTTTTTKGAS